ncbi:MAG: hypothetical protein WAW39_30585 [Prosthecobacter sp.]|uniref:hypothetical protein n=1 Tax=Prosthecobacter sp. TaxID=1965333 RepID=UPI003BB0ABBC
MTTNPCDKAILKAFKNLKDKAAFAAALSKSRTEPAKNAFRSLHDMLCKEALTDVPIENMEALIKGNLPETAEFVFGKMEAKIAALSLDSVLKIAATPRCLQLWIGAGGKNGGTEGVDKSNVVIERFKKSPQEAMQSVLAHWFVACAPAAQLPESATLFIVNPETRIFTSIEELLEHALRRDKDGKFTRCLLTECNKNVGSLERNLTIIRNDTALFDEFVRAVVLALGGLPLDVIRATLKDLFGEVKLGWRTHGREFCRRLVSTSAAMLSVPHDEHIHAALTELDRLSAELQSMMPEGVEDHDACGIRYLGKLRHNSASRITAEGAKLVSIAINKIQTASDPLMVTEAMAFNLGMRTVEKMGATIAFDPNRHEDSLGGALRDDSVIVVQTGWRLGEQVIERARVQRV